MRRRSNHGLANLAQSYLDLRADYAAMRSSQFRRQRVGLGGAADAHYANESRFMEMREYARDMDRNDAIIGQAVDRAVDNLIQTGFRLEVNTGDTDLDQDLWHRFMDWAGDPQQCDVAGENTWWDFEWSAKRHEFIDGDTFLILSDDGQIEAVEAHRCRTPSRTRRNIVHGVVLDDLRRRLAFCFSRDELSPWARNVKSGDMLEYPARDEAGNRRVLQIYFPGRFTQTRGVTVFAPVFDIAGMVEDVQFSKLVQQQMSTVFAAFIERTADFKLGSRSNEALDDATTSMIEEVTPGQVLRGNIGERLTLPSSNIPNAEYLPHMKSLITLIGLRLHLPLALVLLDPSDQNFHGYRGALDAARLSFRRAQAQLKRRLHEPVYRWKVRQFLAADPALRAMAERSGIDIFGHRWEAPGWPYVEPLTDAQADGYRLSHMLASPRQLHAERGRDWDDVVEETVEDNGQAIEAAIVKARQIEERTGVAVSWRDVLNWAPPERITGTTGSAGANGAGANGANGSGRNAGTNGARPAGRPEGSA